MLVSQTRKLLHMAQFKIQISVHIPDNLLTDEGFESYIKGKCYKPHNQVKFFSRTCLF